MCSISQWQGRWPTSPASREASRRSSGSERTTRGCWSSSPSPCCSAWSSPSSLPSVRSYLHHQHWYHWFLRSHLLCSQVSLWQTQPGRSLLSVRDWWDAAQVCHQHRGVRRHLPADLPHRPRLHSQRARWTLVSSSSKIRGSLRDPGSRTAHLLCSSFLRILSQDQSHQVSAKRKNFQ